MEQDLIDLYKRQLSLFANMLWFGAEETLAVFKEVVHLLPARLVVTLGMYAESYFEPGRKRMVKPLGGNALLIEPHYLVGLYMDCLLYTSSESRIMLSG